MEDNISDIIVGLDIGTTKISIIIGKRNQFNKIEILATGKSVSSGVSRGIVSNIDKTSFCFYIIIIPSSWERISKSTFIKSRASS